MIHDVRSYKSRPTLYVFSLVTLCKSVYIVACHLPRAPSYGGVRTWEEGSQMRGDTIQIAMKLPTSVLNTHLTDYLFPYETNNGVGRDNMYNLYSNVVSNGVTQQYCLL